LRYNADLYDSIWDDVIKDDTWVLVYLKSCDLAYYGLYTYGENFEREPMVALSCYRVLDRDGNVLNDCTDKEDVVVLNMKDFERVEIRYKNDDDT